MSYDSMTYKSHDGIKEFLTEFLKDYLKLEDDTRLKFSMQFGRFNPNTHLYFNIPNDEDSHLMCTFYDSNVVEYNSTIFDYENFKLEDLKNDGLTLITVSNNDTRFVAFNDIKNGLLFDTLYSMDDESDTMKVLIAHMPRYASINCYGTEDCIDLPKVLIYGSSESNEYEMKIIQLYDTTYNPVVSTAYPEELDADLIFDSTPVVAAPNYGFTNSFYITPFTYKGYMSKSLYVADGGHSIPPYGLTTLGNYPYIRVTSNVFMRVGED